MASLCFILILFLIIFSSCFKANLKCMQKSGNGYKDNNIFDLIIHLKNCKINNDFSSLL